MIFISFISTRYFKKWSDERSFRSWQDKRIINHVNKIRKASLFYKHLWGDIPSSEWRSFPIIDKQIMMDHFDELNTVGVDKESAFQVAIQSEKSRDFTPLMNGVTVGLSSGTSGNRGLFLASDAERYAWAGTVLAKVLPGTILDREKIAFFLRANSQLYSSVQGRTIQLAYYDLLDPIEQHIQRLNEYQPTILVGPPSLLRMLAEAMEMDILAIRPVKIVSIAEVLDPLNKLVIENAFNQTIHQIYQCTEGFLASTCHYGTLHFNEDIVCIEKEYIDRSLNKFIPVITDFNRISQPIIRYRLNDLITEQEFCPCGSHFTAIKSIDGRSDDMFYLPAMKDLSYIPIYPDFITRAILIASNELSEYKVIQWNKDQLEIMIKLRHDDAQGLVTNKIMTSLNELFGRLECIIPKLNFTAYQQPEKGTKLRRVERKWSIDDPALIRSYVSGSHPMARN